MSSARLLCCLTAAIAIASCTGSSDSAPDVTAPPPTTSPATTDVVTAETVTEPTVADTSTTEVPATSMADPSVTADTVTNPTTSAAESGGFLPADLGVPVDGAPGIDSAGEIVELIENVWIFVPTEADPDDANVVPPLPEDAEIIVAYAEAQAAYHEQASMDPIPVEPSDRLATTLSDGGARLAENIFVPKSAAGEHLDLTDGIVLRPVVIADPRSDTEAFIFDCQFDGTVFVNTDGSLAEGQTPGVKEFPQIASIVKVGDEWIVERLTRDERACA